MRTFALIATLGALAAGVAGAQPSPSSAGEALFVVSGRGYGHGVGMSQYGAYGMARAGKTYEDILAHYYSGTTLGPAPKTKLRVLLAEGRAAVSLSSPVAFTAKDARGRVFDLRAGSLALGSTLTLPPPPPDAKGAVPVKPAKPKPPLTFRPGKGAPLSLDGKAYRGQLEVAVAAAYLRVVNVVDLESYVQGVVSGEMPFSWPAEALRAQAVAARSFALARLVKGKPYDLYADPRSQMYLGVAGEKPATTAAVRATAGKVVLYAGRVATTMYFSSSGGRTASAADVFGTAIPYLVSVADPWDKVSPWYRWGPVVLGARTLQSTLGADARVVDATGVGTPSGRLRSLVLQTTNGRESVPASLVRTALGLRSTWLDIGVLRLDRPTASPVLFGSRVELVGIARGVAPVRVASSPDARSWSRVGPVTPLADGSVAVPVKPARTMRYRMEIDGAASPALLVQVAPRVQLAADDLELGAVAGSVKPLAAGGLVLIERRKAGGWSPARRVALDGSGGFRAALPAGTYRARVPASDSFAEGVSAPVQVSG